MNENVSVISECDNLEIENYLKSCGNYPKNTEMKFVESHGHGGQSARDVAGLIQYSKCVLSKFRNDLQDSDRFDTDRHIVIEKDRLNELLKSKIKEYIRDHPVSQNISTEQIQQPTKIVHFVEKPIPLVRNGRRIKSFDRHTHCVGNKNSAKPSFVSRKSQQIHENKIKTLRIGRNIIVDPTPVTSYYPRRVFNDTTPVSQESHRATWHDRLKGLNSAPSSTGNCTILSTTTMTTSQVIEKSEIKILRYNYDWGGTDAVPTETTGGIKLAHNIDQTTQTENNVVTTKSVECFTEQFIDINTEPINNEQSPIIEPSVVQVSSHESDENVHVTVGSSFIYEYESTFDDSSSDSELSETVRPTTKPDVVGSTISTPKKPNILLESVVYEDQTSERRDAGIQTEIGPVQNGPTSSCENDESQKIIEMQLSQLNEEIMQNKFKLLSVLRHSSRDTNRESQTPEAPRQMDHIISPPSEIQLQLTPLKPRQASDFMPSPLELSSIRPMSLAHPKNPPSIDLSNEKYWKTINKIQMDAARKPFSPKVENDDVAKRAAEKFLKSIVFHRDVELENAEPEQPDSTSSSSCISNVMIVTTSSSEYDTDSTTVSSHRYAQFKRFTSSGMMSDGEVLSLGEVRKLTDNSE